MDEVAKMLAEGEILGFKRTSTFALWGSFAHTSASYDVFVDSTYPIDEKAIRTKVAGDLNTDPHYLRVVEDGMCDDDYPDHMRQGSEQGDETVSMKPIPTKPPGLPPESTKPNGDEASVAAILRQQHDALLPFVTYICAQRRDHLDSDDDALSFTFNRDEANSFVLALARAVDAMDTMSMREGSRAVVAA